jgi:hypothetical protein
MLLAGCATLGGNHQLVSVDSDPRGASATLEGEPRPAGTTPFYLRLQRVPSERIVYESNGKKQTVAVDCSFRWWVELLGNGVLGVLAPEVAAAGVLIDLATGAAFECPDAIIASFPGRAPAEGLPQSRYCRRYVVAPPLHIDSAMSDKLAEIWKERAERALKGCDDFVAPKLAQGVFDLLGIGNRDELTLERLDLERLHYLGAETGATHLVILDYTVVGDEIHFNPKIYDLHRGASVEIPGLAVSTSGGKGVSVSNGAWLAYWTFSALPNSLTYGYSGSQFGVEGRGAWKDVRQEEPKPTLANVLSNLSLTTVEHPQAHGAWDYGLSAYPSVELFSHATRVFLRRDDGAEKNYSLTAQYAAPMYHVAATGHTALGAVQIAFGGGSYFGRSQAGKAPSHYVLGSLLSTEASYTAFLTNTLFFYAGVAIYRASPPVAEPHDEVRLKREFNEVFARVGYYFPALRRRLRVAAGAITQ